MKYSITNTRGGRLLQAPRTPMRPIARNLRVAVSAAAPAQSQVCFAYIEIYLLESIHSIQPLPR